MIRERNRSIRAIRGLKEVGRQKKDETLLQNGFFGGGARNAIAKSVWLIGDEGVTMIAGNSALSSTRGKVRSSISTSVRNKLEVHQRRSTQRCRDKRVIQTLRKAVKTSFCINAVSQQL